MAPTASAVFFLTQRREGARRFWAGAVDERGWKVSKVVRVFKVSKVSKVFKVGLARWMGNRVSKVFRGFRVFQCYIYILNEWMVVFCFT